MDGSGILKKTIFAALVLLLVVTPLFSFACKSKEAESITSLLENEH
jgi:hypothetical protein